MTKKRGKRLSLDWRVVFGAALTILWISAGLIYLLGNVGWANFVDLPTGDIGSFLEGAFAPLAFLWLVIGHFMQQTEISANTEMAHLQEQSARRQELYSRRNSYFKLLSLVQEQLGSIAGFHYVSICGPTGTQEVTWQEYAAMRSEAAHGDAALFVRKLVAMAAVYNERSDGLTDIFFGTEIRTRHSTNFVATFSKLLESAEAVDHDDMVVNALLHGSPSGVLYRIIRYVKGEDDINPITGFAFSQKPQG